MVKYHIQVQKALVSTDVPFNLFGNSFRKTNKEFLHKIFGLILSFLDMEARKNLALVNKDWYGMVKGKAFSLHFSPSQTFKGASAQYRILSSIDHQEKQKIFEKTGFEVSIPPGKNQTREDYSLGAGSNGVVYLGYTDLSAQYVAIKVTKGNQAIQAEQAVQPLLKDLPKGIMKVKESWVAEISGTKTLFQVMDFAGLGSMEKIKQRLRSMDPVSKERVLYVIISDFFKALLALHEKGIAHLDLKEENLLINEKGETLIADFGCSEKMDNGKINVKEANGDIDYFAPERSHNIERLCDGKKIDAWAAGLVFLHLAYGFETSFFPYEDVEDKLRRPSQFKKYFQEKLQSISELKEPHPATFWSIIEGLLTFDPKHRFTIRQALGQPWFANMQEGSASWEQEVRDNIREIAQDIRREKMIEDNKVKNPTFSPLSPQSLPLPQSAHFIERIELQKKLKDGLIKGSKASKSEKSSIISLVGLGGVGKSSLASHLFHLPEVKGNYGLRLYFRNTSQESSLEAQIITCTRELGVADESTNSEEAVQQLKLFLESYEEKTGKKFLIMYDDAPSYQVIQKFFPKKGGTILVTSRLSGWPNSVAIDAMTPQESHLLAQKLLQRNDTNIPELCKAMNYHPHGIFVACGYLLMKNESIYNFLHNFRKNDSFLNFKQGPYGKQASNPLQFLWDATFEHLRKTSEQAFNYFEIVAYLASECIPIELFYTLAHHQSIVNRAVVHPLIIVHNDNSIEESNLLSEDFVKFEIGQYLSQGHQFERTNEGEQTIEMFLNHFLIQKDTQKKTISIHQLVQDVLRAKQDDTKKIKTLFALMSVLNSLYMFTPSSHEQKEFNEQLLPHGESVLSHYDQLKNPPKDLSRAMIQLIRWFSHLQAEMGNMKKSTELLEKAILIRKSLGEADNLNDLKDYERCLNKLSMNYLHLAKTDQALVYLEKTIEVAKKFKNDPDLGWYYSNMGDIYKEKGELDVAIKWYKKAFDTDKEILGLWHFKMGHYVYGMADVYRTAGQFNEALQAAELAYQVFSKLEKSEQQARADHMAMLYNLLGLIHGDLGHEEQALKFLKGAFKINQSIYGENDPKLSIIAHNLGVSLTNMNQFKEAITYIELAIQIDQNIYPESHPRFMSYFSSLAYAYRKMGNEEKANEYEKRSVTSSSKTLSPLQEAHRLSILGSNFYRSGKMKEGTMQFEKALEVLKETVVESHPLAVVCMFNLGSILSESDPQKAIFYLTKIISMKAHLKDPEDLAGAYWHLGKAYEKTNQFRNAVVAYQEAFQVNSKINEEKSINCLLQMGMVILKHKQNFDPTFYMQLLKTILEKDFKTVDPNTLKKDFSLIGDICKTLKCYQEAACFYEKALNLMEQISKEKGDEYAEILGDLLGAYLNSKNNEKFLEYSEKWLQLIQKSGKYFPNGVTFLIGGGIRWINLDQPKKGLPYLLAALTLAEKNESIIPENDQDKIDAMGQLGCCYAALGEKEKALFYLNKALPVMKLYSSKYTQLPGTLQLFEALNSSSKK